ncbi:hypothetical protein ACIHEI_33925 [Kitasatospora sp. NPDC051984]|uniref:hypothetical protein n=1 Tax=Kitasatospora sp. NPDC051984 TaxID=3364059 RepID=UPI0037CAE280
MSSTPAARRGLGPGPGPKPTGAQRPSSRQPPAWARPAPVPDPPAPVQPDRPQPAERAAVDAIAALRMVKAPVAVLESALHLAQALLDRPGEDPLLLEAAAGLAAVIPGCLATARRPAAPTPPAAPVAPPVRLRPAPEATVSTLGILRA